MAKLNTYNAPEDLKEVDLQQTSDEHLDPKKRLEQISFNAQNQINEMKPEGLSNWFSDKKLDAEANAGFRALTFKAKERAVVKETREKIFDLMDKAGQSFTGGLDQAAFAPNLEVRAWESSKDSVSKMIKEGKKEGLSSLSVATGYQAILKEAERKTTEEWKAQKADNAAELQRMGLLKRAAHGFRAEARNQVVNDALDQKLEVMFKGLKDQTDFIATKAERRVKARADNTAAIWHNTLDPDKKQKMWQRIIETTKATNLDSVDLTLFGINASNAQGRIDFAEALMQLDFVKVGLGLKNVSEGKHKAQQNNVDNTQKLTKKLEDADFGATIENLRKDPVFNGLEPQANVNVTHTEFLDVLIKEMQSQNIQFDGWFQNLGNPDLLTPCAQIIIILEHFNADKMASVTVRQTFVNWFAMMDEATNEGYPKYEKEAEVKGCFDVLVRESESLKTALEGKLDLDITTNSVGDFKTFQTTVTQQQQKCATEFSNFEHAKPEFPPADREQLEKAWTQLNKALASSVDQSTTWLEEAKKHEAWKKDYDKKETEAKQASNTLDSVTASPSDSKASVRKFESAQDTLTRKQDALNNAIDREPTQTSSSALTQQVSDLLGLHNTVKEHRKLTKNSDLAGPINKRLKRKILDDFKDEVERAFLSEMEAQDQYSLIGKAAEGTLVSISYKSVALAGSLKFPQDIDDGVITETYQMVRNISPQGILLKSATDDKMITLMGPAVKNREPYKNAIVASAGESPAHGNAIITNLKIS